MPVLGRPLGSCPELQAESKLAEFAAYEFTHWKSEAYSAVADEWNSEESSCKEWQHEHSKTNHWSQSKESEAKELWKFDLLDGDGKGAVKSDSGKSKSAEELVARRRQDPDKVSARTSQKDA